MAEDSTSASAIMSSKQHIEGWEDIMNIPSIHMDYKTAVLRGIYSHGFETPSPIQKEAVIPIVNGRDLIAQAQSGTGKTGAFLIGTMLRLGTYMNLPSPSMETTTSTSSPHKMIIVLAPTRELSRQIYAVASSIGASIPNVRPLLLIGGSALQEDIRAINESQPTLIIGCPGRVFDIIKRRHINGRDVSTIVLDEADEMLSRGFKDQVYNIFQRLDEHVHISLFSATMPPELEELTTRIMRDPVEIRIKTEQLTLEGIKQYYVALTDENKFDTLKDLYGMFAVSQCIIYCNTTERVEQLYKNMLDDSFAVCRIHSKMPEDERKQTYMDFKAGKERVLISTNITARGIDVQQVSVVVNYDMCDDIHVYLHRIGRSGRWGRKGVGINFITKRDIPTLRELEKYYNTTVEELPMNWSDDI